MPSQAADGHTNRVVAGDQAPNQAAGRGRRAVPSPGAAHVHTAVVAHASATLVAHHTGLPSAQRAQPVPGAISRAARS